MPKGTVAHLKKCVYGTRDAGMVREECYATALTNMGFKRGIASPCCFDHPRRNLSLVVHGDDFTCLGSLEDLRWYEQELSNSFAIKVKATLSQADGCDKEARALNRVIRIDDEGGLIRGRPSPCRTYCASPRSAWQAKDGHTWQQGSGH